MPGEGDNLGEPNARNECHYYVFACLTDCGDVGFAQRRKTDCCVMVPWSKCETSRSQHIVSSRLRGMWKPTVREGQVAGCSTRLAQALDMMST